ncbi:hypothetical protein DQ04_08671010 [Trypanosoma grayi]|uniref:hypothetical protein n=1 Tax=Trypanosoma grayi TaxID=71804 RepID=UPI0004F4ADB5|nr:hypothetical protein DQ04_08671010 [Trypanosoma grayi]KEG07842.1 hypothetical protein DQ04_08671010 [Trypanosoma grayi]
MWFENITRDLGDFTSSLVQDTRSLASVVSRFAAEVAGQDMNIAGDEDSLLARDCPLSENTIHALQDNDAVYLEELRDADEKAQFEEWARRSVYSTASMHAQDHGDRSNSSSDETALTCRQRLLDCNALVRKKYAMFVQVNGEPQNGQEAPLPPTQDSSSSSNSNNKSSDATNTDIKNSDDGSAGKPSATLPDSQQIPEDVFFDRYFFRLSQLRLRTAEARRKREEEAAAAAAAAAERRRDEQLKTKSLAERIMEATDELVGWDDEAADGGSGEAQQRSSARTETMWREQEETREALECVVHLLQTELADARRKLAAVLSAAHQCGLREDQLQLLEKAAGASGSERVEEKKTAAAAVAGEATATNASCDKSGNVDSDNESSNTDTNTVRNCNSNNNKGGRTINDDNDDDDDDDNNNANEADAGVEAGQEMPLPGALPQPGSGSSEQRSVASSHSLSTENDGWTNV